MSNFINILYNHLQDSIIVVYLRLYSLTNDGCNRIGVACQSMDICFSPHIPDASCGIPAARNEHVESRMQGHAINGAKMTMIVTDHLQENLCLNLREKRR